MRFLVTGGAGYIGSHVARHLCEAGHAVTVLDQVGADRLTAIADVESVIGDVRDGHLLETLLGARQFDGVIHLAGAKSVDASLRDPGFYFDTNAAGSLALLRSMAATGTSTFVFSSTCAIYGPLNEPPLNEHASIDPQTPYGESKLIVERMLPWFERAHGIRWVALRYFNAAGASDDGQIGEEWDRAANLVPMVMKAMAGVIPVLTVNGRDYPTADGTAVRDYVHVLDLAIAHRQALDHLVDGGQSMVLNLGTGRGASVLDVVHAAEEVSGRSVPLVFAERRPGDLASVWADPTQAHHVLGWRAERDLEAIVGTAWRWHSRATSRSESS